MVFRTPYDSTVLCAVAHECQSLVGGRLQKVAQPDETTCVLHIYTDRLYMLLLSCDAQFPRAYLTSVKQRSVGEPPNFCMAARKLTEDGRILAIRQREMDRLLEIEVRGQEGANYQYAVELMGKHSNVVLVGPGDEIVATMKSISSAQAKRKIQVGLRYSLPPDPPGVSPRDLPPDQLIALLRDEGGENVASWLRETVQGMSPFLADHLAGEDLSAAYAEWRERLISSRWEPYAFRDAAGHALGAYPMPIAVPAGVTAAPRSSISEALDAYYLSAIHRAYTEAVRNQLRGALGKSLRSTDKALAEVDSGRDEVAKSERYQVFGELLLAFGQGLAPKSTLLRAPDYTDQEGGEVEIALDPQLSVVENAERYFRRARKAKQSAAALAERSDLLTSRKAEIEAHTARLDEMSEEELLELRSTASNKGWLSVQPVFAPGQAEKRPYEGHRIREVHSADGTMILYAESATANDYLTQRVARPNDWWLHVRGAVSAHAIIPTGNRPEKTPRSALLDAARIVARNSPSKHSNIVPVDYTLRKHVRKPRGAPPGTVLYSHEKTLHIEPGL